jgi:DNA-binding NarL/FixJ family response regulator
VVVVSASDRSSDVIRSIDLGAMGFVPKRASNTTFQLRAPEPGGSCQAASTLPPVMDFERVPMKRSAWSNPDVFNRVRSAAMNSGFFHTPLDLGSLGLTPRKAGARACAAGASTQQVISRGLDLSVETVKEIHVRENAVLQTPEVSSRTQAQ